MLHNMSSTENTFAVLFIFTPVGSSQRHGVDAFRRRWKIRGTVNDYAYMLMVTLATIS